MKIRAVLAVCLTIVISSSFKAQPKGKHLFILSGQSNMVRLDLNQSFLPAIEVEFGKENVIVVKYAKGSQPIRRWYKGRKARKRYRRWAQPDLYSILMRKVFTAIEKENIATITFIWMQGERDARYRHGKVYEKSLIGLYNKLCKDLRREQLNFVIGRLSDHGLLSKRFPHWKMIRNIQVKVAESDPSFAWVDTDDLNDGKDKYGKKISNNLHMSEQGYLTLGERFANKSIELIKNNP